MNSFLAAQRVRFKWNKCLILIILLLYVGTELSTVYTNKCLASYLEIAINTLTAEWNRVKPFERRVITSRSV